MQKLKGSLRSINVGLFLGVRQIRRSNPWTSILVIFIMTLTFLNLVVISGLLVGLIEGVTRAYRSDYIGDVYIKNLKDKVTIEKTSEIVAILKSMPEVKSYTTRLIESGFVEANYRYKNFNDAPNILAANIAGIDPVSEDNATHLSKGLVAGDYLNSEDSDEVLVGTNLLEQYTVALNQVFTLLKNVTIGSKIRLTIGSVTKEYTVKGFIKSKIDDISYKIYMTDHEMRNLSLAVNYDVSEIAVFLNKPSDANYVKRVLLSNDFGRYADIRTAAESDPKFILDIKKTFAILGNAVSSIGVVVAAITLFIVIFINAITRRKFIGILKGIGIDRLAIEISYVCQAVFYGVAGSALGIVIVFLGLKPLFDKYPIDFPFSDGILVATLPDTIIRVSILLITTIIAGYIPARMIAKGNTLNAILGR